MQNKNSTKACSSYSPEEEEHEHTHEHEGSHFDLKLEIIFTISSLVLLVVGLIFEKKLHATPYSFAEYLVFITAYLLSGWQVLLTAGRNLLKGKFFDENFLMSIATLGAIAIHQLPEAVGVMLFFKVGELFQELAVQRSRKSIKTLLEIRPDYANLKINGEITKVSPETVKLGDIVLVKPGEKIPLDGEVIEGSSQVDTSALTGESVPRNVKVGEIVLAGMLNKSGVLSIKVTKLFGESSIARILNLVENASTKKAETEKFITKFAKYYTPIVVFVSLTVAILPPLIIQGATFAEWIYRALIVLVVSCPCGLVISIPLGYFGGIGGAASRGILIKGSTFLDSLAAVGTVVFDKTGTLSKGVFKVTQIVPQNGFTEAQLLALAVQVESQSNHPVAQSIKEAYKESISPFEIQDYEEIGGHGIKAKIDNKIIIAGNDRLLHRKNIEHDLCDVAGTVVHLAVDNLYAGYIVISDELKEDAKEAIEGLKRLGIQKIVMLTGDNQAAAERISKELGLEAFVANLLPEDKVKEIEKLISEAPKNSKVAFLGDGINDAPVIARADVGMAMGGLGSDAAIETADVVIMTDAPSKVTEAIKFGQKTRQIVWQNISFALSVKVVFIVLGVSGAATMWEAVFGDVGVALIAIFNSMRILRSKND